MRVNVNSAALDRYTRKLESLSKSKLPSAVRNTLNNAAFDVKGKTMPATAKQAFTQRKPSFFKANSKVVPAKGGKLEALKATVGFVPKDSAVNELKQQEHGGAIRGRSFIANKDARTGNSWSKMVRSSNRVSSLTSKPVVRMSDSKATSRKQKYVKAAIIAHRKHQSNALVLDDVGTKQHLIRITSVRWNTKKRTVKINSKKLYSYRKGRAVSITATHFMQTASIKSGGKLERYFITNAQKIINELARSN